MGIHTNAHPQTIYEWAIVSGRAIEARRGVVVVCVSRLRLGEHFRGDYIVYGGVCMYVYVYMYMII